VRFWPCPFSVSSETGQNGATAKKVTCEVVGLTTVQPRTTLSGIKGGYYLAHYTSGAIEVSTPSQITFQEFVEIVKGRSVVDLGDFGPDRLELFLSGRVVLRIFSVGKAIEVNCFSNQQDNEPLAFAFPFGDMPKAIPVWQLETKLRGLRTLFAIFYLLANNREKDLASYLAHHPSGDIDGALLSDADNLQIESLSHGSSWIATAWTKTRDAAKIVMAIVTLVYPRARDAFVKKIEAEAELKDIEAKRGAVALERDRFELAKDRVDYVLELVSKVEGVEVQEILRSRVKRAVYELAVGDVDEEETRNVAKRMLPTGKAK
jgi:hypothetical protein